MAKRTKTTTAANLGFEDKLWAARSNGRCLFVLATKKDVHTALTSFQEIANGLEE
jgi:hypothetical protein